MDDFWIFAVVLLLVMVLALAGSFMIFKTQKPRIYWGPFQTITRCERCGSYEKPTDAVLWLACCPMCGSKETVKVVARWKIKEVQSGLMVGAEYIDTEEAACQ